MVIKDIVNSDSFDNKGQSVMVAILIGVALSLKSFKCGLLICIQISLFDKS